MPTVLKVGKLGKHAGDVLPHSTHFSHAVMLKYRHYIFFVVVSDIERYLAFFVTVLTISDSAEEYLRVKMCYFCPDAVNYSIISKLSAFCEIIRYGSVKQVISVGACCTDSRSKDSGEAGASSSCTKTPTELPFQLQVKYTDLDGGKAMRVLTQVQQVTSDRAEAEARTYETRNLIQF